MFSCIENINNKRVYNFSFDKLVDLNNWCAKTYFEGCTQLYNLGRIPTPSCFDKGDFIDTLSDDEEELLINPTTGQILLDYKFIDALLLLNKFEDRISFIYLAQILYAIEVNNILCDMNKAGRERSNTGIEKVSINVKTSDHFRINKGTNYFNYDILQCLADTDEERFIYTLDLRGIYLEKIAEYLGIKKETYQLNYYATNKSMMFKNHTYDDDKEMVMCFLNGQLFGNTAIAKKFKELYFEFYKNLYTDKDKNKPESFFDKVFKDCLEEIDSYIEKQREHLLTEGVYYPNFIEDRSITPEYYTAWVRKYGECHLKPKHRREDKFYIGAYLYDAKANDFMQNLKLILNGLSGEYISYKDRRKYEIKGFPVIMEGSVLYPTYNISNIGCGKCDELPTDNSKLPDISKLNVREKEIFGVLRKLEKDNYSVEELISAFESIDKWWKIFSKEDKEVIINNIMEICGQSGV